MRAFALLLLILIPACGGTAKNSSEPTVSPLVGTWTLDPAALLEIIREQTREDLRAEGKEADKLTAAQIKMIETSVAGCRRTVDLNADGTFTSSLLRDVPGEKFTEESSGTWSSTESEVILKATHIAGEEQTPPEIEKLTRKNGGLEVDYYDHLVPLIRK